MRRTIVDASNLELEDKLVSLKRVTKVVKVVISVSQHLLL